MSFAHKTYTYAVTPSPTPPAPNTNKIVLDLRGFFIEKLAKKYSVSAPRSSAAPPPRIPKNPGFSSLYIENF